MSYAFFFGILGASSMVILLLIISCYGLIKKNKICLVCKNAHHIIPIQYTEEYCKTCTHISHKSICDQGIYKYNKLLAYCKCNDVSILECSNCQCKKCLNQTYC